MSSELVASHLSKAYRGRRVVDDVSFYVKAGEVVGLLGPNGAGKTTSFSMVVGLVQPLSGSVTLDGKQMTGLPMHLRARAGLGYLPQEPSIFRKLTVRQNLLAVLELSFGSSTGSSPRRPLTHPERLARANALLDEFRLTEVADSLGESLSGGERRRAEIARSLIPEPRFMLFDEPFAGVDPITVAELQNEIRLLKARGLGVLITDHNVRDTLKICDRASIIAHGRILEEGTPERLAASPNARTVYLGEGFTLG